MRFVLISFAFLAFAFYELSGGSEFEPRENRAVAVTASKTQDETRTGNLARQETTDDTRTLASRNASKAIETPRVTRLDPVRTTSNPAAEDRFSLSFQVPQAQTGPSPEELRANLQLASLAEGGQAFRSDATDNVRAGAGPQPAAQTAALAEEVREIRTITGSRVNMRQGPGTTYAVIGTLYFDDQVEVMEDLGNGWVRLRRVKDDRIGWMAGRFVGKPVN